MSTEGVINATNYYEYKNEYGNDNGSYYYDDSYDNYVYEIFKFEYPVYLYIWVILVSVTSLVNIVVILVLMSKSMRNPNHVMLVAIAIVDTFTGFTTLPSYMIVFLKYEKNASILDKHQCIHFMISKYYLSQVFHTMSILLTMCLGCQRYICIRYPFKAQTLLTMRNTLLICGCIFALAPILHIYQAIDKKAKRGMCHWTIEDDCTGGGCAYLWVLFVLRHFIPCVVLVAVTTCFIKELQKGETTLRRMDINSSQILRRAAENKRMCVIVLAIVIVFLIPEIPYGIYLFVLYILHKRKQQLHTETNRLITMIYELALVLSFHANFYIYTVFNKSFRKELKRTLSYPISLILNKSSTSLKIESRSTGHTNDSPGVDHKLKLLKTDSINAANTIPEKHQVETLSFLDHSKDISA